ncbi:hypothetical protein JYU29_09395 [Tianweitania sp. BSSL-BM11]|uniref:Uncharacterized protein n=1 Tax=Tianweitania aestuarii TaxID=2814886 RepID=A0ABS5RV24_9HYPH|nr:hypothetical protein [Tianweitania aestuarii]MBS9720898.1 hypothetical protein [Tianweitania aestuarii]
MSDKNNTPRATPSNTNLSETDLASDKMGNNQLQGNDQETVHNQRQAVPDAKKETEGVVESFENMDPKTRAERENNR